MKIIFSIIALAIFASPASAASITCKRSTVKYIDNATGSLTITCIAPKRVRK